MLVTSANDSATVDQAAELGVNGYLVKPFRGDDVQGYMAPLCAPHAVDESPQASMARLGISAERLQVYLGGFQTQVSAASADIAALLEGAEHDEARTRLARLHAGCLTLGLNGAAAGLSGFPPGRIDGARVQTVLAATVGAVTQQVDALKRLHAAA